MLRTFVSRRWVTKRQVNRMGDMYKRLSKLGLKRSFVQKMILPSWWDDDAASTASGFSEGLMILSRHLGIPMSLLRDEARELKIAGDIQAKHKAPRNALPEETALVSGFALQVARLVAQAVQMPVVPLPSAAQIRDSLLQQDPWVGFENLLEFCWLSGIAVIHLSTLPPGAKRVHGLAARIDGRPVIVICSEKKHPAWLLFILAHELGHHACGHLAENGAILDEVVDRDSSDKEEQEANAFALELLTGNASTTIQPQGRWPNRYQLLANAREFGRAHQIDPGHVVLNFAHSMGANFFALANAALALLGGADAPTLIRSKMAENLDWDQLPSDSSEFVSRLTQTDTLAAA